jgi:predicted TIM-barrel fold metal-dependent hydrolase
MIIDAQVHAFERDHPGRPWAAPMPGPSAVTGDDMVEAMDRVGVDGALLVSPWTQYRYDPSYVIGLHDKYPGRFALITPVDHRRADVRDVIERWAQTPGAVGVRAVLLADRAGDVDHPGLDTVMEAAARHGMPVCILCPLHFAGELASRHPGTQLVIDHLGLHQPLEPPPPPNPFADLDSLLALAHLPNVAVKVTGAPTLSHEGFPFDDLWEPLRRVFTAFGIDRCMWGSDWTRTTQLVTYDDAVEAFRLTDTIDGDERAALLGGTAQRIFGWAPRSSRSLDQSG